MTRKVVPPLFLSIKPALARWPTRSGTLRVATGQRPAQVVAIRAVLCLCCLVLMPAAAAAPAAAQAESQALPPALEQALREKRLITPAGQSAVDLFEKLGPAMTDSQRKTAVAALVAALRGAGEEIVAAYMEPRPPRANVGTNLSDAAVSTQEFEIAARLFERAAELAPGDTLLRARARFARGRSLTGSARWDEAESLLREALRLDPAAAFTHNALGVVLLSMRRHGEAVNSFQAAIERAPRWVYARHNLALAYFQMRRYEDAEREWVVASVQEPRVAFPHVNLGVMYLQMGRRLDAERELKHALQIEPAGALVHHNLGVIYETSKRIAEAEASYRKAIEFDPAHTAARLNLAELYRRGGRVQDAERELAAAARVEPGNPAVHQALGDLQSSRGEPARAIDSYREALNQTADPAGRARLQRRIMELSSTAR